MGSCCKKKPKTYVGPAELKEPMNDQSPNNISLQREDVTNNTSIETENIGATESKLLVEEPKEADLEKRGSNVIKPENISINSDFKSTIDNNLAPVIDPAILKENEECLSLIDKTEEAFYDEFLKEGTLNNLFTYYTDWKFLEEKNGASVAYFDAKNGCRAFKCDIIIEKSTKEVFK